MAKRRPKKTAIDPLRIGLQQLAIADSETALAVRFLCSAILADIQQPEFTLCTFELAGEEYSFILTSNHCDEILQVVEAGGNVQNTVAGILGGLTKQCADTIASLMQALGERFALADAYSPVQLGCCTYTGGQTANLTQAQCNQYNGAWDNLHPECTYRK